MSVIKRIKAALGVVIVVGNISVATMALADSPISNPTNVRIEQVPGSTPTKDKEYVESLGLEVQDRELHKIGLEEFKAMRQALLEECHNHKYESINDALANDYIYEVNKEYLQGTDVEQELMDNGIISTSREQRIKNADEFSKGLLTNLVNNVYLEDDKVVVETTNILNLSKVFDEYFRDEKVTNDIVSAYENFIETLGNYSDIRENNIYETLETLFRQITSLDNEHDSLVDITEATIGIQKAITSFYSEATLSHLTILLEEQVKLGNTSYEELSTCFDINALNAGKYTIRNDVAIDVDSIKNPTVRYYIEVFRELENYAVLNADYETATYNQVTGEEANKVSDYTRLPGLDSSVIINEQFTMEDYIEFCARAKKMASSFIGKKRIDSLTQSLGYIVLLQYIHNTPLEEELTNNGIICDNKLFAYYNEDKEITQYDASGSWTDINNTFAFIQEIINNLELDVHLRGQNLTIDDDYVPNLSELYGDFAKEDKANLEQSYEAYMQVREAIKSKDEELFISASNRVKDIIINNSASNGGRLFNSVTYGATIIDHADMQLRSLIKKGRTTLKEISKFLDIPNLNRNTFIPLKVFTDEDLSKIKDPFVRELIKLEGILYPICYTNVAKPIYQPEYLNYIEFATEAELKDYISSGKAYTR